ncbi:hypothetical protein V8V75_20840 [Peribacillus frigoritolerans]
MLFNPYTPQMKYFVDYLNTLSNGGRFLINSLTGISKSAPQLISIYNDHEYMRGIHE